MKKLTLVLGKRYLISFFSAAFVLVCLFSLLEFSEQLEDFGKGEYGYVQAVFYVLLTMPDKAVELAPFSAILGAIVFLGTMSRNRELLALQACGLSWVKVVSSTMFSALVLAFLAAVLTETWSASLSQKAHMMRARKVSEEGVFMTGRGFWAKKGNIFLNVGNAVSKYFYQDIYIYRFSSSGKLKRLVYAEEALVHKKEWILVKVLEKKYSGNSETTRRLDSIEWPSFLKPDQEKILSMPAYFLSFSQLYRILHSRQIKGQNLDSYLLAFWRKTVTPLAMLVLTLAMLPFFACKINIRRPLGMGVPLGIIGGGLFYFLLKLLGYLALVLEASPGLILLSPVLLLFLVSVWLIYRRCVLS